MRIKLVVIYKASPMTTESDNNGPGPSTHYPDSISIPFPFPRFPKEESPRDTPPSQLNMGYTAPLTLQRIKGLPVV